MANPARGETRLTIDGREHTVRFSLNTICEVEDALGAPFADVMDRLDAGRPRLSDIRGLIWGGLREAQPRITLSDAGELLGAVARGGKDAVEEMTVKLLEAVTRAFPEGPPPAGNAAAPSTGRRSTRKRSKPASKPAAPGA